MIIDVKSIVSNRKEILKDKINNLRNNGIKPKLAVILASFDEASKIYVSKKKNMCEELNIDEVEYVFNETVTQEEILQLIDKLNNDNNVDGILVQLPLYSHLNEKEILNSVDVNKDVDGFHPLNLGKLITNENGIISCTPKGIMNILKELNINFTGLNAVVVGRSVIVGKPIAHLLLNEGCTVTICHSKTKDLSLYTKNADILVVAVGVPHLIKEDMVNDNCVVIDVGINRVDGKIVGDVDTINVEKKVKHITPVPGGVGLTTILSLLENLVQIASLRSNK
jgi:methylenetetrahydrofolate dehydrogenase (NADP+) / methenyltetrahydrofolate cyclohydrolase